LRQIFVSRFLRFGSLSASVPPKKIGFGFLCSIAASAAALTLGGCATKSATYELRDSAAVRVPTLQHVIIAPIDAELAQLSAGGMLEPREEWTTAAAKNISAALAAETGFEPVLAANADTQGELQDAQAQLRAITLSRLASIAPGRAPVFPAAAGPLTYNTGPLSQHVAALHADAVLFVFIRESYATAGRKSLVALSVVGAALTGVAIVPPMGSRVMSAALVDQDGKVLWFNHSLAGHDPREPEGARELVKQLLTGLPRGKA
jgi:hypothetical protein